MIFPSIPLVFPYVKVCMPDCGELEALAYLHDSARV